MKTITEHIRSRLLSRVVPLQAKAPTCEIIKRLSWFPRAIAYARNRMVMGYFRYGSFKDPGQPRYDRVGSAIFRLREYQRGGNTEHLIDALNLCGIEFENPQHKNAHFTPIDDGYHTEIKG